MAKGKTLQRKQTWYLIDICRENPTRRVQLPDREYQFMEITDRGIIGFDLFDTMSRAKRAIAAYAAGGLLQEALKAIDTERLREDNCSEHAPDANS